MSQIWNKKTKGIISAFIIGTSIVIRKIATSINTTLFQLNICSHGTNNVIMCGIKYRMPTHISMGSDIIIGEKAKLLTEELSPNSQLIFHDGVTIGDNCSLDFTGGIEIFKRAHIAHDVLIITHTHGYQYDNKPEGRPLIIKGNSFIGSRAIITYNCNYIGENAVIGLGSVVTKDVPDNAVVAGNPAKLIKYRDDL